MIDHVGVICDLELWQERDSGRSSTFYLLPMRRSTPWSEVEALSYLCDDIRVACRDCKEEPVIAGQRSPLRKGQKSKASYESNDWLMTDSSFFATTRPFDSFKPSGIRRSSLRNTATPDPQPDIPKNNKSNRSQGSNSTVSRLRVLRYCEVVGTTTG